MKRVGERCLLSELEVEQKAKVIKLSQTDRAIRKHLLNMGVTRGVELEIKKKAPLGDPIDISLRDYELCLRKAELAKIEVEVLK